MHATMLTWHVLLCKAAPLQARLAFIAQIMICTTGISAGCIQDSRTFSHAQASSSHTCQARQQPLQREQRSVRCKAQRHAGWQITAWQAGLGLALSSCLLSPAVQAATGADPYHSTAHFHPVAADIGNLADNEQFWQNFVQYGRFFTSVLVRARG